MLVELLIPLGVAVVLPITIVAIVFKSVLASERNRKEIILAALEKNPNLNVEDLVKRMKKSEKLIKEKLLAKLQHGCLCCLMGVAFVLLYFFHSVQKEIFIIAGTCMPWHEGVGEAWRKRLRWSSKMFSPWSEV